MTGKLAKMSVFRDFAPISGHFAPNTAPRVGTSTLFRPKTLSGCYRENICRKPQQDSEV